MEIQCSSSPNPIRDEETKSMESSANINKIDELRKQLQLSQKRENLATLRLTVKEKQYRDLMDEIESIKRNSSEQNKADCTLVDHAVGVMFTAMRDEVRKARKDAKLAALELRSLKNGSESAEAKELAAICRYLEKENAEMKDEISRTSRLETLLAFSRKTVEGLRKRCRDFDDILAERDEEIKRLQTELARAHEENIRLKRTSLNGTDGTEVNDDNEVTDHSGGVENNVQKDGALINDNAEEVVSVSSPESAAHDVTEEDGNNEQESIQKESATGEAINVSSPESVPDAPEAETISSDEDSSESSLL